VVALNVYSASDACNISFLVLQLQSAVCLEQCLSNREWIRTISVC